MSTRDVLLKVSLPGYDVKTATPEECAIHSDYDTLKLKLDNGNPYFQRIIVDFVSNPPLGTINVFSFTHNLPNTPAYYFFFSLKDSSGPATAETGNTFDLDATQDHQFIVRRVGNTIFLDFVTNNDLSYATVPFIGKYFEFRFYCYTNDGI